mmetsp:Transcript_117802/g.293776  ORF Transcript_117802/g.293776 Transcript_117802/m.293776 type:complete len:158 (-) Transcript_117802:45-518(-)
MKLRQVVAICAAVLQLAGVNAAVDLALTRRHFRAQIDGAQPLVPECNCLCCVVQVSLLKSAITGKAEKKCLPAAPDEKLACTSQCRLQDSSILANTETDSTGQTISSYSRFCFMECRLPSCDSPAGEMVRCLPLDPLQAQDALTIGGNGRETGAGCY